MSRLYLAALLSLALLRGAETPSAGSDVFRSNCAFCHGLDGKGGRGPSLISTRVAQTSDEALRAIIHRGIPGTAMPAFDLEKEEVDPLIAHIRSFSAAGVPSTVSVGDAAHGRKIYESNGCAGCHRIGWAGSIYGPELSRIGLARSVEYLRQSVVDPSADIQPDYQGVSVATKLGRALTGVRINEDTFSLQLRLPNGEFALFKKQELDSITYLDKSPMPAYNKLPTADLDDLIAYLGTLQGTATGSDVPKLKGIQ